jgi:hypothetical protein
MQITAAVTKNHRQTHPTSPVIPKQSILNGDSIDYSKIRVTVDGVVFE